MINFENQICEYCGKSFDKDSDIVVCPDCGTPHHRECWMATGHCVNRDKHSRGFEWKPTARINPADTIKCTDCGRENPAGTLFCENCGKALKPATISAQDVINNPNTKTYNMPGMGQVHVQRVDTRTQEGFNNFVNNTYTGEIDGISTKDIAAYIGPNAQYYTFKFKRMDSDPRYKPFNWTAFFFAPLWFMFRKLWKMAILTAIFNFATGLPTIIVTAVQAGLLSQSYMFPGIETAASVLTIINTIISIAFGFMAIPMYRKDTVRRLNNLKAKANGDSRMYYNMLLKESGPSKIGMIAIIIFIAFFFFSL